MTTVDAPVPHVWAGLPTHHSIRTVIMKDRAVAITAIAALTLVVLGLFATIAIVVVTGGDPALVAGAIGTAIGALGLAVGNIVKARRNNGTTTD